LIKHDFIDLSNDFVRERTTSAAGDGAAGIFKFRNHRQIIAFICAAPKKDSFAMVLRDKRTSLPAGQACIKKEQNVHVVDAAVLTGAGQGRDFSQLPIWQGFC
jgi:hypothetical protein